MHLVWREILTKFYKMVLEKMKEILQKLNLGIQVEKFEQERIDPQVILASSDNDLVRLGICTIGDRVRLRELCRASVESDNQSSSDQVESVASRVANERNLLFAPGSSTRSTRRSNRITGNNGRNKTAQKGKRPWTVHFVCLADRLSVKVPNAHEKQVLHAAGLGSKKIKLDLDDDEQTVLMKFTSAELENGQAVGFPELKDCGGFEMMLCSANCRQLSSMDCAWDAQSLKSSLGGGQAKIYLRPIQKSISTKPVSDQKSKTDLKEKCQMCDEEILLCDLRIHFMLCSKVLDSYNEDNASTSWGNVEFEAENQAELTINSTQGTQQTEASGSAAQPITIDTETEVHFVSSEEQHTQETHFAASEEWPTQANSATGNVNSIEMKVKEVAEHCKQTGASNNPAEILRHLQTLLVCERALEVTSHDSCPEGLTNFVMIDRQNLLKTAFEEIQSLENKLITLEVQFYNEVSLYFSRLGSSLFQEKSKEKMDLEHL